MAATTSSVPEHPGLMPQDTTRKDRAGWPMVILPVSWQDKCMEATPATATQSWDYSNPYPHSYQSMDVPNWRTCALCGAGANAKIHRKAPQ